jgi:hypothetical protein
MPVPVKAPRSSVFDYLEPVLVMPIKQLVGNPTRRCLVGQLKSQGAKPLHVDYRDNLIRKDTSHGGVGMEIFEAHHALIAHAWKSIVSANLAEGIQKPAVILKHAKRVIRTKFTEIIWKRPAKLKSEIVSLAKSPSRFTAPLEELLFGQTSGGRCRVT